MSENSAIENLRNHLSKFRNDCEIDSPLDELIEEASSFQAETQDENLQKHLKNSLVLFQGIKDKYEKIIVDVLKREKPFSPLPKEREDEKPAQDLGEYDQLIRYSNEIGSTVLLDELGIYRLVRDEGKLGKPLQFYINYFDGRQTKETGSPLLPYIKYLSLALSYLDETNMLSS